LGRFGIDLIADRIEHENTVVDLLDYDVRFGQGALFSPPRPIRADAFQAADVNAAEKHAEPVGEGNVAHEAHEPQTLAQPTAAEPAAELIPFARVGMRHS
jgi:cyclic-di-GMP phosphodiesterase TipF (flagellum assembly factor)